MDERSHGGGGPHGGQELCAHHLQALQLNPPGGGGFRFSFASEIGKEAKAAEGDCKSEMMAGSWLSQLLRGNNKSEILDRLIGGKVAKEK